METANSKAGAAAPVRWHTGRLSGEPALNDVQSRPANSASEASLASLVDVQSVRSLLDDFSALSGIPTALLDLEGNILQGACWQKACTEFHRAVPTSCANCVESDLFLAGHLRPGEFVDYKCRNGLWDVVTPVFVGDHHLGNLYSGQFFYDDDLIDEDFFVAQAGRHGYDREDYLAAIREIPRFSREHVRRAMSYMVGLASYLSKLSLVNQQLSESRARMETLINALPDPVWLKDTEGAYLSCNHAVEKLVGRSAADIIGKTDYDFFSREVADFYRQKDREAIEAGEPRSNEEWIPDARTGEAIFAETVKAPVVGSSGKPVGVIGVARNITERKRAEAEAQRFNAELEARVAERTAELVAANQELEAFSFATSHDLKGPLQRINSFSTLLESRYRDRLEGDGILFLDIIRQNCTRLAQLVDDLLSHARISQQSMELQALDLSGTVQAVVQEKRFEIEERKAVVTVALPAVRVLADAHTLGQVLGNLVENALKYASEVDSPHIEIGGEMADGRFRLWVRDHGIGFDMAYHDKIFEMFRRLHTYSEYKGSGVGLALVKRAMERMGGRVWAESEPGQGATFFLEFQLA
ncbi:MAG: PocR ligand-binding domain-containing protein [Actinomycetota bacterium]